MTHLANYCSISIIDTRQTFLVSIMLWFMFFFRLLKI